MKTQRRILLVVGAFLLAFGALVALAELLLGGLVGPLVVAGVVVAAIAVDMGLTRPGQVQPRPGRRWRESLMPAVNDAGEPSGGEPAGDT
jgi:hypothetical protein